VHPGLPLLRDHSNSRVVVIMSNGWKESPFSQFRVISGAIVHILPSGLKARWVAVGTCCECGSTSILMYAPFGEMSKDAAELRIDVH
jgi:hypothetical protein